MKTETSFVRAIEQFIAYLLVHRGASKKTAEQYELHLWKFLEYLDPEIGVYTSEWSSPTPTDHRLAFLDSFSANDQINLTFDEKTTQKKALKSRVLEFLRTKCRPMIENVNLEDLDGFRLFLVQKWISVKTANAYMISMRSFFKFLRKRGIECIDPTMIDLVKQKDRQVTFLDSNEVERIFEMIDTSEIQWKRDLAILECVYSTGLRVSELTALDRDRVNLETKEFAVRGKGWKVRIVYLTDRSAKRISEYLMARTDSFSPLFIRHNFDSENIGAIENGEDVRLSRFFITEMVKRYALKAWVLKDVSIHTLRHSFATTLLGNGADIRSIQELLGHSSITTTQVYTHVTDPKLKEIHQKFHTSE